MCMFQLRLEHFLTFPRLLVLRFVLEIAFTQSCTYPPRPLASRRANAHTNHQTLKTSESLQLPQQSTLIAREKEEEEDN